MATKKIKLGDSSTWATMASIKEVKPRVASTATTAPTSAPAKGVIRLPEWKDEPALGSTGPQPNSPFVPRKAWDVGGKEKYVIKYPAGYDPVTRTYSAPTKEVPKKGGVLSRLGDGAGAVKKWLGGKGGKGNTGAVAAAVAEPEGPPRFGKAARQRFEQHLRKAAAGQGGGAAGATRTVVVAAAGTKRKVEQGRASSRAGGGGGGGGLSVAERLDMSLDDLRKKPRS